MIDLFRFFGERGEQALRRSVLFFAGAGLVVIALGFCAAAIVEALGAVIPRYAALGAAAVFLLGAAAISFALARDPAKASPASGSSASGASASSATQSAFSSPGDWRSALNFALIEEAREKPARAAALAALAGLILGVLEGLDDGKNGKSGPL